MEQQDVYTETKLETAILNNLQRFLLEMGRGFCFEYRNGSRLIPPALQENIRDLFRENGWTADVQFDDYVEDYDW